MGPARFLCATPLVQDFCTEFAVLKTKGAVAWLHLPQLAIKMNLPSSAKPWSPPDVLVSSTPSFITPDIGQIYQLYFGTQRLEGEVRQYISQFEVCAMVLASRPVFSVSRS